MTKTPLLHLENKTYELPFIEGTEGEKAVDVRRLRAESGYICFDQGYGNTGSCESQITYIDGDAGILRHRGYPIEQLAEQSEFVETAYLVIYGELPNAAQRRAFGDLLRTHAEVEEPLQRIFEGFPRTAPPMTILASVVAALAAHHPELAANNFEKDLAVFDTAAAMAISKTRTLGAMIYRHRKGLPFVPSKDTTFCENFLHMMFSQKEPGGPDYLAEPEVVKALNLLLLLHADHEQNCSTAAVRMVGSSSANLFASLSAGVSALSGPLHGGANTAVMEMLQQIHDAGDDGSRFIEQAKSGSKSTRLMGFGHAVYRNFDPRAKIIGAACEKVLAKLGINDPLLDIARHLEQAALRDDYFLSRKLYPNVDFYSGIIMRALGIPVSLFTVIFAMGRTTGWIANWYEVASQPKGRIYRPRQVYTGPVKRDYVPMAARPL
ncbi:type II citrate synthase [Cephaloticoccus capnophilus]|uniref:Citrate synthase n=1 Tax=Cephaloticoccus capnophilus TaxID=1548208 RepID=A0A139SJV3_9BACT|nr:citrate synthase [Cephaloticoccus capnophilus]KXU34858.1 type II citrate synthase [Cephaloticoccus capnophilus]